MPYPVTTGINVCVSSFLGMHHIYINNAYVIDSENLYNLECCYVYVYARMTLGFEFALRFPFWVVNFLRFKLTVFSNKYDLVRPTARTLQF